MIQFQCNVRGKQLKLVNQFSAEEKNVPQWQSMTLSNMASLVSMGLRDISFIENCQLSLFLPPL